MNFQDHKKLIKEIGIGLVVIAILVFAYYFFVDSSSTTTPASTTTTSNQTTSTDNTDQIANTLAELDSLRQGIVDSKSMLESNHAFKSLNDFSVVITAEPYGDRDNPFAETAAEVKRDSDINKSSSHVSAPVSTPTPASTQGSNATTTASSDAN